MTAKPRARIAKMHKASAIVNYVDAELWPYCWIWLRSNSLNKGGFRRVSRKVPVSRTLTAQTITIYV